MPKRNICPCSIIGCILYCTYNLRSFAADGLLQLNYKSWIRCNLKQKKLKKVLSSFPLACFSLYRWSVYMALITTRTAQIVKGWAVEFDQSLLLVLQCLQCLALLLSSTDKGSHWLKCKKISWLMIILVEFSTILLNNWLMLMTSWLTNVSNVCM